VAEQEGGCVGLYAFAGLDAKSADKIEKLLERSGGTEMERQYFYKLENRLAKKNTANIGGIIAAVGCGLFYLVKNFYGASGFYDYLEKYGLWYGLFRFEHLLIVLLALVIPAVFIVVFRRFKSVERSRGEFEPCSDSETCIYGLKYFWLCRQYEPEVVDKEDIPQALTMLNSIEKRYATPVAMILFIIVAAILIIGFVYGFRHFQKPIDRFFEYYFFDGAAGLFLLYVSSFLWFWGFCYMPLANLIRARKKDSSSDENLAGEKFALKYYKLWQSIGYKYRLQEQQKGIARLAGNKSVDEFIAENAEYRSKKHYYIYALLVVGVLWLMYMLKF